MYKPHLHTTVSVLPLPLTCAIHSVGVTSIISVLKEISDFAIVTQLPNERAWVSDSNHMLFPVYHTAEGPRNLCCVGEIFVEK